MLGGAIRVSTPFMFVALGECLTEKSGRINLGLEGTLVLGAMAAYAIVLPHRLAVARRIGAGVRRRAARRASTASICKLPRVNDVAIGIAMMLFGIGLAFFFGKPYIQPTAPRLPSIPLGDWTGISRRFSAGARRSTRCSWSASLLAVFLCVGLPQHALGPDRAHDRRQRAGGARHGHLGRPGALPGHGRRRLPRRRRRRVPVALLSGLLERGPVVRPGPDGGRARHLRALEPAALRRSPRCCSAPPARSARRCSRSASRRATTSSTPRPTS